VTSREGAGSTFTFELPVADGAARCKSQQRCSSDLPWRLVVAKAISDSKEVGR